MSLTGARGDAGAGFRRASVNSCAAVITQIDDDAIGMTRIDGNQVRVYVLHSALVSHIYTW